MLFLLATITPHSGGAASDGFELSDFALFVAACIGVWLARRSMRARARRRSSTRP